VRLLRSWKVPGRQQSTRLGLQLALAGEAWAARPTGWRTSGIPAEAGAPQLLLGPQRVKARLVQQLQGVSRAEQSRDAGQLSFQAAGRLLRVGRHSAKQLSSGHLSRELKPTHRCSVPCPFPEPLATESPATPCPAAGLPHDAFTPHLIHNVYTTVIWFYFLPPTCSTMSSSAHAAFPPTHHISFCITSFQNDVETPPAPPCPAARGPPPCRRRTAGTPPPRCSPPRRSSRGPCGT